MEKGLPASVMSDESKTFQGISKALGVDSDVDSDFDELEQQLDESLSPEEAEAREKEILLDKRKNAIETLNSEIDAMTTLDDGDFIKETLKKVAKRGFKILNAVQQEIDDDPRDRTVEVAANTMGAITHAVEVLDKFDKGNKQITQSQEKIELRRREVDGRLGGGSGGGNTFIVANTNDLLRQLAHNANEQLDQFNEVEIEATDITDSEKEK
jgi:hypothetical protein